MNGATADLARRPGTKGATPDLAGAASAGRETAPAGTCRAPDAGAAVKREGRETAGALPLSSASDAGGSGQSP